jgi:hypothetical protein
MKKIIKYYSIIVFVSLVLMGTFMEIPIIESITDTSGELSLLIVSYFFKFYFALIFANVIIIAAVIILKFNITRNYLILLILTTIFLYLVPFILSFL